MQGLAAGAFAFFARTQTLEILHRFRNDITIQSHLDALGGGVADGHVEEDRLRCLHLHFRRLQRERECVCERERDEREERERERRERREREREREEEEE